MGNAYLALVNGAGNFNKLVVLKVLKPEFAEDQEFLAMFRDEARIAANLNHPNVVQTHELGVQDEHFYIAMDFVDGQPLRIVRKRLQENGALSLGAHLRLVVDVLEGLHYAHEMTDHDGTPLHLVHRDVSPHNVMVSYDGHAKLLDFGIAKSKGSQHQTSTGVLKGKVGYMAPEQARCENLDRRADIFPVGVLVWEAIVGGRMWGSMTDVQVLAQLVRREIPQLPDAVDGVPIAPELRRIVAKATAAEKENRYETAREFANELEAFVDTLPRSETSARSLADLLNRHFGVERDKRRKVVDEAIRQVRVASSTAEYPAMLGLTSSGAMSALTPHSTAGHTMSLAPHSGTPSQPSISSFPLGAEGSSPGTLTPSTSAPFVAPVMGPHSTYTGSGHVPSIPAPMPPPGISPIAKIGMVGAALVVLLVGALALAFRGKDTGAAGKPEPSAAVAEDVRLEVQVAAGPARPTAFVDGREVSVGSPIRFSKDSADHTLRVRAEGYKDHNETIRLDKDQRISLALVAEAAAVTTPTVTAVPHQGGHHTGYTPPKTQPAAAAPPPPSAAPPPPSATQPPPSTGPKRPDRPIIEVLK